MAVGQDRRKLHCLFWFVIAMIAAGIVVIIILGGQVLMNLGGQ